MNVNIDWQNELCFNSLIDGHKIVIDADPSNGGNNEGPRPKKLVLLALGGCTGMDVISILKKMKVEITSFKLKVNSIVADEHPKTIDKIEIIYSFEGKNIEREKVEKAVNLSIEKYCGVYATLIRGTQISHSIKIIE